MSNTQEHFHALAYGVTLEQYRDARRIARKPSHVQMQTAALALCLKYSSEDWKAVIVTANTLVNEGLPEE